MSRTEGDTWATSGFERHPGPGVFVQWKGTDVCLDFSCSCGYSGHYDGGFAYGLKCYECGKIWTMPHSFGLIEGGDDGAATQETDRPHVDGLPPERLADVATFNDFEERE